MPAMPAVYPASRYSKAYRSPLRSCPDGPPDIRSQVARAALFVVVWNAGQTAGRDKPDVFHALWLGAHHPESLASRFQNGVLKNRGLAKKI